MLSDVGFWTCIDPFWLQTSAKPQMLILLVSSISSTFFRKLSPGHRTTSEPHGTKVSKLPKQRNHPRSTHRAPKRPPLNHISPQWAHGVNLYGHPDKPPEKVPKTSPKTTKYVTPPYLRRWKTWGWLGIFHHLRAPTYQPKATPPSRFVPPNPRGHSQRRRRLAFTMSSADFSKVDLKVLRSMTQTLDVIGDFSSWMS